jgi:pyruvate,water dikinase
MTARYILPFSQISITDIPTVGGKNASLGEMTQALASQGIPVPGGFAVTAAAYRDTLESGGCFEQMQEILSGLDTHDVVSLKERGEKIRRLIRETELPDAVSTSICVAYRELCSEAGSEIEVAVRSSATAEDLPDASFAGQQETYLNIRGEQELLRACRRCFASLFTDRAISYRVDKGFDHFSVALSIGVQKMVRSDLASSGVMFSIDTETGFRNAVLITGIYGLGENIVQGKVNPDEFYVFKPTLETGHKPIISKSLGTKRIKMIYDETGRNATVDVQVPRDEQERFVITDEEILTLARWACEIEEYYSERSGKFTAMDIEWAKDGNSGELFIVQARPETVVSARNTGMLSQFRLLEKADPIACGRSVGKRIGCGPARVITTPREIEKFQPGEVLITETTDPDWEPIMKVASAIVTEHGGRTSHAAIVSRELGIPCVVGAPGALSRIPNGEDVTVSCAEGDEGHIYLGRLEYEQTVVDISSLPTPKTKMMLNIGDPDNAFELSFLPNDGVGLARLEFIISSYIRIHPRALLEFDTLEDATAKREIASLTHGYEDRSQYFVDKLAEGAGRIAAAFYPKPVIVRLSDFKTNEYANLIGGQQFEPHEENPMIGWRGASRYYSEGYRAGFALECRAMKKIREEFGLTNLKLMIPFCRTVDEGRKVVAEMNSHGLVQGENGLEIFVMCELPSNVLLADQFLEIFDGFSIGSNDLTQLTLGLDRDSEVVSELFDERNEAVKNLVSLVVTATKKAGKYIGICGDAPSTYPEFAAFLVEAGIESMSLSPDAVLATYPIVAEAEGGI